MDLESLIQAGKTLDNAEVPRKGKIIYDEETDTFMEGDFMDDESLRLECVREAGRSFKNEEGAKELTDKARKIYDFCKEGDNRSDSIKGDVVPLE